MKIHSALSPTKVTGRPRRRLTRALVVVAIAVAGVFTVSGAASAAAGSTFNSITNAGNGKCLDVVAEDGYYNIGARVQQYHCTGAQEQKWRAVQINSIGGFYPTWEIVSQRSGLCLGREPFADNGEQAVQLVCDGGTDVGWYGGNLGNGNFDLVSTYDSRLLDLAGNSSADHAKIQLYTYNASNAQKWRSNSFFPTAF
jgi:hypothetical protein